jgi:DNA processing protein
VTAEAERRALLILRALPGLGDRRALQAVQRHGSSMAAVEALTADGAPVAAAAREADGWLTAAQATGLQPLAAHLAGYPRRLRGIDDPPAILWLRGDGDLLDAPAVAIVGSRRCTTYGRDVARHLGRDLAAAGVTVVSGLALGIDAAAHEGAVEQGCSLAVLGTGADLPWPAAHARLYDEVLDRGAVVSEMPPGARPGAGSFPRRNRIISGLSLGVIVVEAPRRSGALITARRAREQGRPIFAVPGEVTNPRCAGTLDLLREGAHLTRDARDVLEQMGLEGRSVTRGTSAVAADRPSGADGRLLDLLHSGSSHVDHLSRESGLPTARLLPTLLRLELEGRVQSLPGGAWSRRR